MNLSQPPCLTLPLHERQDITLAHRTFDVTDNGSVRVVQKLDTDLGHVTRITRAPQNLVHLCEFDWLILQVTKKEKKRERVSD